MAWFDHAVFCSAIFLLVIGLIFEASGFGVIVAGRLDGIILIVMGVAMFWGGWLMSGARGFSCATAAVLNMFDAASTISFWNFEINPLVRIAGPTIFFVAKVVCSITIMLYAKFHHNPGKGGILLTFFFGSIVGWNLGQHALAYLGVGFLPHGAYFYVVGALLSFAVSAIVLWLLFLKRPHKT